MAGNKLTHAFVTCSVNGTQKIYSSIGEVSAACGVWQMPSGELAHVMCPGYVLIGDPGPTECACQCHAGVGTSQQQIARLI